MRSYPFSLSPFPPHAHPSAVLPLSFLRFPPLRLSPYVVTPFLSSFLLFCRSLYRSFVTEMYELFLKEILVISLPQSISGVIFCENEPRIANASTREQVGNVIRNTNIDIDPRIFKLAKNTGCPFEVVDIDDPYYFTVSLTRTATSL